MSAAISAETGALTSAFYSRSWWPIQGRRIMRRVAWGTISVTTLEASRNKPCSPHHLTATPLVCGHPLRGLHAIILFVAPHRIQDASEASGERDDRHAFAPSVGESFHPRV